jgi:ADP-ribose pyrophosphatase YjhB (NUDIX family)
MLSQIAKQTVSLKIAILLADKSGRILLIRESYDGAPKKWNVVRGTYDKAGESLIDWAERECLEEVGLRPQNLQQAGYFFLPKLDSAQVQFNFIGHVEKDPSLAVKHEQEKRGEDISSWRWFTRSELEKLREDDFVRPVSYKLVEWWLSQA